MSGPPCYVASPLGFTEAGRHYYAEVLLPALATVVTPVDPWGMVSPAEVEAALGAGRERELWLEVGRRNAEAIAGSRLLVACLDGQELDAGTASEVGYAAAKGIPCFGLRSDLRRAGEPGMRVNLQVEAFIVQSGGSIEPTLDALLATLGAHLARPV